MSPAIYHLDIMRRHDTATAIRAQLCNELTMRLGDAGWHVVHLPSEPTLRMAAYIRPLDDEFAATVEIFCSAKVPDILPIRLPPPRIGVSYEPIRRLGPLLDGRDWTAILYRDPNESVDQDRECSLALAKIGEISVTVAALASTIERDAVPFAERYSSVDALLTAHGWGQCRNVPRVVPTLLTAANRFDEARTALDLYRQKLNPSVRDQQLAYQLTRWLERGTSPDPRSYQLSPTYAPQRTTKDSLISVWRSARARDDAIQAVDHTRKNCQPSQLLEMLRAELARRNLSEEPLWIHQQIEILSTKHSPPDPTRETEARPKFGKVLRDIGATVVQALNAAEELNRAVPKWLQPPAAAVYSMPQSHDPGHRWAEVQLNHGSLEQLDRIYSAVPRPFRNVSSVTLDAWLSETPLDDHGVAVYIGGMLVGTLNPEIENDYRPVMAAAARREEMARLASRLTPISTQREGYLLEIARPCVQSYGISLHREAEAESSGGTSPGR